MNVRHNMQKENTNNGYLGLQTKINDMKYQNMQNAPSSQGHKSKTLVKTLASEKENFEASSKKENIKNSEDIRSKSKNKKSSSNVTNMINPKLVNPDIIQSKRNNQLYNIANINKVDFMSKMSKTAR